MSTTRQRPARIPPRCIETSKVHAGESVKEAEAKVARDLVSLVLVKMEIINATKWPLINPVALVHGGVVEVQPVSVPPGTKEVMVMRKHFGTPTGSYGTISWDVNDEQVIVMWSVPFPFSL